MYIQIHNYAVDIHLNITFKTLFHVSSCHIQRKCVYGYTTSVKIKLIEYIKQKKVFIL